MGEGRREKGREEGLQMRGKGNGRREKGREEGLQMREKRRWKENREK